MNKGVRLLMQRMDSHPEEFRDIPDRYKRTEEKWDNIMHGIYLRMERMEMDKQGAKIDGSAPFSRTYIPSLPYLSDEEVTAVYKKLVETQGKLFEQEVMKTLLADPDMSDVRDVATTASMGGAYR